MEESDQNERDNENAEVAPDQKPSPRFAYGGGVDIEFGGRQRSIDEDDVCGTEQQKRSNADQT